MDHSTDHSLSSVIFEHALKNDFKNTIDYVTSREDLITEVTLNNSTSGKSKVKPIFMLLFLLKKIHSSNILSKIDFMPDELPNLFPVFIDLLQTTFRQCSFISLKKYFTLMSELKLLDLLGLIIKNVDSQKLLQKLNQHFPRWTPSFRAQIEKDFSIENSKILDKVEESHGQCRRLILKLAVDLNYRSKYMLEQYPNDIERIVKESNEYITETIKALEAFAGSSSLEVMTEKEDNTLDEKDLSTQLLFQYIEPNITDDALVKYLEDLEPTSSSQPTTGLTSCLLPFDSISEDEESDSSESEYEFSQSGSQPVHVQDMQVTNGLDD